MNEINNFEEFFKQNFPHYFGRAVLAWIEQLQQIAYSLASQDFEALGKEEESNVSIGEANNTEQ